MQHPPVTLDERAFTPEQRPRDEKLVASIRYTLANYDRRYPTRSEAPDQIRQQWEDIEAELQAELSRPSADLPDSLPAGPAPGVHNESSPSLFDIDDVRSFARSILNTELRRRGQSFQAGHYSYDDALGDLIRVLFQMAWRYDPARTPSFKLYATFRLANHAVPDIGRKLLGRNGARAADGVHAEIDERADQGRRPWEASPEDTSDLLARGERDRGGLETGRVGSDAWRGAVLSLRLHRRAADSARVHQRDLPDSF